MSYFVRVTLFSCVVILGASCRKPSHSPQVQSSLPLSTKPSALSQNSTTVGSESDVDTPWKSLSYKFRPLTLFASSDSHQRQMIQLVAHGPKDLLTWSDHAFTPHGMFQYWTHCTPQHCTGKVGLFLEKEGKLHIEKNVELPLVTGIKIMRNSEMRLEGADLLETSAMGSPRQLLWVTYSYIEHTGRTVGHIHHQEGTLYLFPEMKPIWHSELSKSGIDLFPSMGGLNFCTWHVSVKQESEFALKTHQYCARTDCSKANCKIIPDDDKFYRWDSNSQSMVEYKN